MMIQEQIKISIFLILLLLGRCLLINLVGHIHMYFIFLRGFILMQMGFMELVACNLQSYVIFGLNRGWASDENRGENESYYLFASITYFTLSPLHFESNASIRITSVNVNGDIRRYLLNEIRGVQFQNYVINICFEAGFLMRIMEPTLIIIFLLMFGIE